MYAAHVLNRLHYVRGIISDAYAAVVEAIRLLDGAVAIASEQKRMKKKH